MKASELLLASAEPFDKACMMVRELEAENEALRAKIARLNHQHKNNEAANNMLSDTCARQKEEIERLRQALQDIADGNCRMTPKAEKCTHGQYGYEHCENCYCEFAEKVLLGLLKE